MARKPASRKSNGRAARTRAGAGRSRHEPPENDPVIVVTIGLKTLLGLVRLARAGGNGHAPANGVRHGGATLADWMARHGVSDAALTALLAAHGAPVNRSTVNRLRRGVARPGWRVLAALRTITRSKVSADTFLTLRPRNGT